MKFRTIHTKLTNSDRSLTLISQNTYFRPNMSSLSSSGRESNYLYLDILTPIGI